MSEKDIFVRRRSNRIECTSIKSVCDVFMWRIWNISSAMSRSWWSALKSAALTPHASIHPRIRDLIPHMKGTHVWSEETRCLCSQIWFVSHWNWAISAWNMDVHQTIMGSNNFGAFLLTNQLPRQSETGETISPDLFDSGLIWHSFSPLFALIWCLSCAPS